MISPVMKLAKSEATKRIGPAISSGVPARPRGITEVAMFWPAFVSSTGLDMSVATEPGDAMFDELLIVHVLAHIGFERLHASTVLSSFLLNLEGGILGLDVTENHVGARLSEEFDGSRADAARTPGDKCRLACE